MAAPGNYTSTRARSGGIASGWSARPKSAGRVLPEEGFELIGRYGICDRISSGGMASVHLGFLIGTGGFSRFVALKRMHPEVAEDPLLAGRFRDEVLLGARIRHPNVVQALDVLAWDGELLLVMEYIHGENLAGMLRAATRIGELLPLDVGLGIVTSALHGLHAAHEVVGSEGEPLLLVHRDFSPHNLLIGSDGHARVLDFGVAKSLGQSVVTRVGEVAGKVSYMAPEQLRGEAVDRTADVFSAGAVLWEVLAGRRLFGAKHPDSPATVLEVLSGTIPAPSDFRPDLPKAVERAVMRALNRNPRERFQSAREFALALEASGAVGGPTVIAHSIQTLCGERLLQLGELQARSARVVAAAGQRVDCDATTFDALRSRPDSEAQSSLTDPVLPSDIYEVEASPKRPRTGRATLLALVAGVGLAALWLWVARPPVVAAQALPSPSVHAESNVSRPEPAPRLASPAPAVAAPPAVAELPAAEPPPAAREARAKAKRAAAAPAKAAAAPDATCAQPTYLDERGIRRFKRQCL